MKLLYLSCHSILEYDEIKLFGELGIDVFSHGVYTNPLLPGDPKRPPVNLLFHQDLYNMAITNGKENLHQDMIDWADVIVVMHWPDWIPQNWAKMKKKRVIWRSIGQSTLNVENILRPFVQEGLEIVRYSPREATIPGFAGANAVIRFYKDPDEFGGWTGSKNEILSVGQSMKDRKDFCNYLLFEEATRDFPRAVYGEPSKGGDPLWKGKLPYDELKKAYQDCRAYFYTGTYPASYTLNFIEAWMTGCPIVSVGRKFGNSPFELGQSTYEVPDLLDETGGGVYGEELEDLKKLTKQVFEDRSFAEHLSQKGREGAIRLFGKETIKEEWRRFLNV